MINTQLGAELHSFLDKNPDIFVSIHVATIDPAGLTHWMNMEQSSVASKYGYLSTFSERYKTKIAEGQRVITVTLKESIFKKHSPADASTLIYHELMCHIKMELEIMKKEGKDIKTAETRDQT